MSEHGFDNDADRCAHALRNVHAFLHGELSSAEEDVVRQHLMACERCEDDFHVEEIIDSLLKRSDSVTPAPEGLHAKIRALSVQLDEYKHDQDPAAPNL